MKEGEYNNRCIESKVYIFDEFDDGFFWLYVWRI